MRVPRTVWPATPFIFAWCVIIRARTDSGPSTRSPRADLSSFTPPSCSRLFALLAAIALTAHLGSSVGWLGVVAAYLALAITGLTSDDARTVSGVYRAMELIGWFVVVPFGLAALLTGLLQSLGTQWGLFRHYWIVAKLVLTVGAVTIAILHMPAVSRMSGVVASASSSIDVDAQIQLVAHTGGALLVLLAITALSVFKPLGKTPYGRRQHTGAATTVSQRSPGVYLLAGMGGLILIFLLAHLIRGGVHGH